MRILLIVFVFGIFSIKAQSSELQPCSNEEGKYGFCDASGEVVIDHKFSNAFDFVNGHAPVKDGNKWGIINESGNWMVKPVFDEVLNCDNAPDLVLVRDGKEWSFINAYGIQMSHTYEIDLPIQEFDITNSTAHFSLDSWFAVIKNDKWGVINVQDEIKVPFQFDWIRILKTKENKRFVVLKKKEKYGYSFADDRHISSIEYDNFLGSNGSISFFQKNSKSVLIDMNSGDVLEKSDSELNALINTEDRMGLVNEKGQVVLSFDYQFVDPNSLKELVIFGTPGAVGLADVEGKIILRPAFNTIRPLNPNGSLIRVKNLARKEAVYKVEGTHLTNLTGFVFDSVTNEENGISVTDGTKSGFINESGEVTWSE